MSGKTLEREGPPFGGGAFSLQTSLISPNFPPQGLHTLWQPLRRKVFVGMERQKGEERAANALDGVWALFWFWGLEKDFFKKFWGL